MNAAYRPQEHAAALADWTTLLLHQTREIAALRGDVARLVAALPNEPGNGADAALLDALINAAFEAMGTSSWSCGELFGRTLGADAAAFDLSTAMTAVCRLSPGSLGIYLSTRIPGPAYVTRDGLEIRRSGRDAGVWLWTIARV
jgi:hypothetical protein